MSLLRTLARLPRLALPLSLVVFAACRGGARAQAAAHHHAPAEAAGIDWSQVTSRDLDIASVFLVARDQGVRPALDSLQVLARGDHRIDLMGHQIAHAVGRFAVERRGFDAGVFAECRPAFLSGCYHGVLEGWMAGHPGADAASLRALCATPAMATLPPYAFRECAHGLGHGLAGMHGHDIEAALPDCDVALTGALARRECYDGVYMENVVFSQGGESLNVGDAMAAHHQHAQGDRKLLRVDDPSFPCDSVASPAHAPACWSYQPVVFLNTFREDVPRTLAGCDAAPAGSVGSCYRGFGKQMLGRYPQRPDSVARICAGTGGHAAECVGGMVEFYVDQEWKADSAFAFCATAPGTIREACYRAAGERAAWIDPSPAALRSACAAAGPYAAACLSAAEAEHAADALPRAGIASPPAPRPAASGSHPAPAPSPPAMPHHHHTP